MVKKRLFNMQKGIKIYEECSDGSKYFIFDHADGMYSYCITEKLNPVHLAMATPLVKYKDGYKIKE